MDIKQNNSTLIVGGDSTIGGRLVAAFEDDCNPIWQTTRHHTKVNDKCLFLDLSDDMNCWHLKHESFKTSIFCAAITSHEQCQLDSELSWHVNVKGTVALATRMAEAGTFVIFISSNAVFNGESPFVRPNDPVTPQTEYGRQKAEAEEQLLKLGDKVAIVRFSKVITPEMPLISRWIRDLKAGIVIHPFIDMVIAPVPIAKLFDGMRHDSGDPFWWADLAIEHYRSLKIDPLTKTLLFSDGVNPGLLESLVRRYYDQARLAFGVGTDFTNDLGVKPLNMVMKAVMINGKPVAKVSDSPGKGMCEDPQFEAYLKKAYLIDA